MGRVALRGAEEIGSGGLAAFDTPAGRIAVANVGGVLHAFDDTCTHRGCSLSEGDLDGPVVTCPCHGGEFDVRTGEVLGGPPPGPVRTYRVHGLDGSVEVDV
jgi:nitrite reductase/ring-hydroxylating ferredoxin subunit